VPASVESTNLTGANLEVPRLEGADLFLVNLASAILVRANLWGAKMMKAGQLEPARSLEGAPLPDGTELPRKHL